MFFDKLEPEVQHLLRQKELTITPIGAQKGTDRFPVLRSRAAWESRRQDEVPVIKDWRLNLTRFSQVYNLYLVACADAIYVYEPIFPTQSLPGKPSLIIKSQPSLQATAGYVDRACPHSINHLVVDRLGKLEIAIIACDDGDVVIYYMHDIQAAIESRYTNDGPVSVVAPEVPIFYRDNVGHSAWGIGVHSESRKIVISANNSLATVIEFGLHMRNDVRSGSEPPNPRSSLRKYTFGPYGGNLPSVTFCNTTDDPEGKFLVIGHLSGHVCLQDLTLQLPVKLKGPFFCKSSKDHFDCRCSNSHHWPHSIWGLHAVDKRSFRSVLGYWPAEEGWSKVWDGTIMRSLVPDSSGMIQMKDPVNTSTAAIVGLQDDLDNEDADESLLGDTDIAFLQQINRRSEQQAVDCFQRQSVQFYDALPAKTSFAWKIDGPSGSPASTAVNSNERSQSTSMRRKSADSCEDFPLPSPLVVCTKETLMLLQADYHGPMIAMHSLLRQRIFLSHQFQSSNLLSSGEILMPAADRMSLSLTVPELGALLVGSPSGRVGVFSLLKSRAPADEGHRDVHFMRLDWILPLNSQEDAGLRPPAKLVGLSASPIQSTSDDGRLFTQKLWRVLLYYADHSILAYELRLGPRDGHP